MSELGHTLLLDLDHTAHHKVTELWKMVNSLPLLSIIIDVSSLCTVPSGYPMNMRATALSPTQVKLEWEPVPAIDRNGIITQYEVIFNQTTIDTLNMSGVNINNSELSATVHPLQPFIPYNISVRAYTRIGPGPLNPTPVTTMTNPLGRDLP